MVTNISNGIPIVTEPTYSSGFEIVYQCDANFSTRDDVVTRCEPGLFTWSLDDNPPECLRGEYL